MCLSFCINKTYLSVSVREPFLHFNFLEARNSYTIDSLWNSIDIDLNAKSYYWMFENHQDKF